MISLFGENTNPAYSIRTYFNIPELSFKSGAEPPPYSVKAFAAKPSTLFKPPVWLYLPLPKRIIPPQSPAALCPEALSEVNTIGASTVPIALSLAPLVIIKAVPVLTY